MFGDKTVNSRIVLLRYQQGAKKRNLSWSLTQEFFFSLIHKECYYCGLPPSNNSKYKGTDFLYTGIDRIDNDIGYEYGNVVPCCKICNMAKRSMKQHEFIKWIDRITKFRTPTSSHSSNAIGTPISSTHDFNKVNYG